VHWRAKELQGLYHAGKERADAVTGGHEESALQYHRNMNADGCVEEEKEKEIKSQYSREHI
jgi:hypothetical protein